MPPMHRPSVLDEFEVLRQYLRHRIEDWLRENPERQAQEFAQLAGISPGWISAIRKGERFGPDKISAICEAFELTLGQALEESREWQKTQPKRAASGGGSVGASSESMQIALRQLDLEGRTASDAVLAQAARMMRQKGDMAVDRWRETIRGLISIDEMGELDVREEDTRHEVERTGRKRRAKKLAANSSTMRHVKPKGDGE